MTFPNKAGDHADTDDILTAELHAAGIQTLQEAEGKGPDYLADMLREMSGEVKTSIIGILHGWEFRRAWYYWVAKGPGIEVAAAERLHASHGRSVRVSGHCGCPSPREQFKGLACGSYHVDDAAGLKALADTIKELVEGRKPAESGAPLYFDLTQEFTKQLATAISVKTDGVLREAVTRFFGRDDWTLDELKGRAVIAHLPIGVDVFSVDGVALLELLPTSLDQAGSVITAARQHRFLIPALLESGENNKNIEATSK